MIGAASAHAVDHRARTVGVLALLLAVAFHLLGCLHGPAGEGPHLRPETVAPLSLSLPLAMAPADAVVPVHRAEQGEGCPDGLGHAVDRVRGDAHAAPTTARTPLAVAGPASSAGTGKAASPADDRGPGGRGVLAATCVART
ncbi:MULTISPECIES: hypothetical protein [unclassified Streptomyces]|uniref:hypothetical protein n=1 Tax=unclassified Streptomyces TaxID=2593676 RepID=UPI002E37E802|nr:MULTISPECIES: hypothetical protein [unclassified Streptomyces]WUC67906.1 hypothetical protein OG861_28770 [Streptomyces sp. NBC_00539]